jgi:hypothetical protein
VGGGLSSLAGGESEVSLVKALPRWFMEKLWSKFTAEQIVSIAYSPFAFYLGVDCHCLPFFSGKTGSDIFRQSTAAAGS